MSDDLLWCRCLYIGCEPSLSHKQVLLLQPSEKREPDASGKVSVLTQSSIDVLKSEYKCSVLENDAFYSNL